MTEIVIAARNMDAARSVAAELGEKATTIRVDIRDEAQLASQMTGSDIIVNTIGPDYKVTLPALRAAISAGVNYCDVCCHGLTREKAVDLDGSARASEVTALMGIGIGGLSNLMMMHAAHQFDLAEEIRCSAFSPFIQFGDPDTVLSNWRKSGHADASSQTMMRMAAEKTRLYRNGRWIDVDPVEDAVRVRLPLGGEVTAYPVGMTEPITIPRALPNVRSVSSTWTLFPPQLNEKYFEIGHRVARGELDESEGIISFYEYLAAQPKGSVNVPKEYEPAQGWFLWVEAVGLKKNQRMRYTCWPIGDWDSTAGPLATAAIKILRRDIRATGVLSPESCLDPMPFFAEVAQNAGVMIHNGRFLGESFGVLGER